MGFFLLLFAESLQALLSLGLDFLLFNCFYLMLNNVV